MRTTEAIQAERDALREYFDANEAMQEVWVPYSNALDRLDAARKAVLAILKTEGADVSAIETLPKKHAYVRHDGDTAGCAVCYLHRADPIHTVGEADRETA